jgi:uncharacterized protein YjbI with pentapeptide repeats
MGQITIRGTSVDLPLGRDEANLDRVTSLGAAGDSVSGFAVFDQVRASGPVLFTRCSLREADFTACNLTGALFDECDLFQTNFGRGRYVGCDLRGNDLSMAKGVQHLRRAVLHRFQLLQLAHALAAELDVTLGDD